MYTKIYLFTSPEKRWDSTVWELLHRVIIRFTRSSKNFVEDSVRPRDVPDGILRERSHFEFSQYRQRRRFTVINNWV